MVTRLHGVLKRELLIKGQAHVLTLDDNGLKLTIKGRRNGQQLRWEDFVSGDAALATALNASLAQANDVAPVKRVAGPKRAAARVRVR